jgi:hypothetical protein
MYEHDYDVAARAALPPPPPPHPLTVPLGPAHGQAPQLSPQRRLAVQPPRLRTVLAPQVTAHMHGQQQASGNATPLGVPFSPFVAASPSIYAASPLPASPMAMRNTPSAPYNPQQWTRNGQVSGQHAPHPPQMAARVHDLTGMEGTSFSLNLQVM